MKKIVRDNIDKAKSALNCILSLLKHHYPMADVGSNFTFGVIAYNLQDTDSKIYHQPGGAITTAIEQICHQFTLQE